jgi:hypothetical protein
MREMFQQFPLALTVTCAAYVFAFVVVCVNAGCLCIVRTLCMINMTMSLFHSQCLEIVCSEKLDRFLDNVSFL